MYHKCKLQDMEQTIITNSYNSAHLYKWGTHPKDMCQQQGSIFISKDLLIHSGIASGYHERSDRLSAGTQDAY